MSSISRVVRAIRCGWPTGRGGAPGQGDVDPVVDQLAPPARRRRAARRSPRAAPRAPCGRGWRRRRPPPVPPAAARRSRAGSRSARLCGRGSGPAAPPARRCLSAASIAARGLGPDLLDPLKHQAGPPRMAGDDIRWAAIAAAAATLSDSAPAGASGIVTCDSHSASTSSGRPSRSAPRQSVRGARERLESPPRGRPARPAAPASPPPRPSPAAGRRSSPCSPAPPSARRGRRSRARATTVPPSSASAVRTIVADVAGVADPVQVDARSRRRARPSAAARPRSPASPSRARRRRRAAPARPPRRRAREPAAASTKRGSAPAASPASSRSSPSVANSPSRSRCLRSRSLRTSFSFSFCGLSIIGSFGVVVFCSAVSSPGTKKRAVFTARPGEWSVGVPLGGRTLPG